MEKNTALMELEERVAPVTAEANAITVQTHEDVERAKDFIRGVRDLKRVVDDTFEPMREKAYAAYQEILKQKKKHLGPLDEADKAVRAKIGTFLDAEEARQRKEQEAREAEQRRLRDEALRNANRAIDRLLSSSQSLDEQIFLIQSKLDSGDGTALEMEALRTKLAALEAKKAQTAEKLEQRHEQVEELADTPVEAAPEPETKTEGVSSSKDVDLTVTNAMAIVKAVASGQLPISVVDFNIKALKQLYKGGMRIPGISVKAKRTVKVRG